MRIEPKPMVCAKCAHEWDEELLFAVQISVFVAQIKTIRCPNCGAGIRSIYLKTKKGRYR